jgi:N-acetylglucosaminyldiphosphoundecaprenol N-acetyl-beta-D-mannosaminyltransferase
MNKSPIPDRQVILGVSVSATSCDQVAAVCGEWAAARSGTRYICVTSVHGVITAMFNPAFRAILNRAEVVTPDGMPIVWALRSFGRKRQQRVYGPDLMLALCRSAAKAGHGVFLYGGRPEVLPALAERLEQRFHDLRIVGLYSPPFRALTAEEDEDVTRMIRDSGASIVFVGISTPKQERWMAEHVAKLPGVTMLGVGAAFDFHAGRVRQAPAWMQEAGLEWLFRLMMEPARLWKRYLLVTPLFLPLWALQRIGILRYGATEPEAMATSR